MANALAVAQPLRVLSFRFHQDRPPNVTLSRDALVRITASAESALADVRDAFRVLQPVGRRSGSFCRSSPWFLFRRPAAGLTVRHGLSIHTGRELTPIVFVVLRCSVLHVARTLYDWTEPIGVTCRMARPRALTGPESLRPFCLRRGPRSSAIDTKVCSIPRDSVDRCRVPIHGLASPAVAQGTGWVKRTRRIGGARIDNP